MKKLTVTEKFENGNLVERTTIQESDENIQMVLPWINTAVKPLGERKR